MVVYIERAKYVNDTFSFSIGNQSANLSLLITLLINNIQDDELIKGILDQKFRINVTKRFGKL